MSSMSSLFAARFAGAVVWHTVPTPALALSAPFAIDSWQTTQTNDTEKHNCSHSSDILVHILCREIVQFAILFVSEQRCLVELLLVPIERPP